jgi:hypothetical protein
MRKESHKLSAERTTVADEKEALRRNGEGFSS